MAKATVLCVDDEPGILEGLELHLRRRFRVRTAGGGEEGLRLLAEAKGPVAIVVSDMRMPGMNGAEFLTKVREQYPDAVRMLLTGQSDMDSAIAAVNQGQIFRFLTKPCPPDVLLAAFAQAEEQHRLVVAEKELLGQTLHGAVKALTEILGLTRPEAFGRSTRVADYVRGMCDQLDYSPRWPVEIAAMVSQLGSLVLSDGIAEKIYHGKELTAGEAEVAAKSTGTVSDLLGNIPRLEPVLEILAAVGTPHAEVAETIRRPASMLSAGQEYDVLVARGLEQDAAVAALKGRLQEFEPAVVSALARHLGETRESQIQEIPIRDIREGMVLADDVKGTNGTLLVARGFRVSGSLALKLKGFRKGFIKEPVRVIDSGS